MPGIKNPEPECQDLIGLGVLQSVWFQTQLIETRGVASLEDKGERAVGGYDAPAKGSELDIITDDVGEWDAWDVHRNQPAIHRFDLDELAGLAGGILHSDLRDLVWRDTNPLEEAVNAA
jgi:hypothetical protein